MTSVVTSPRPDFDIGIIGGGPAGAATAAYLAKAGVRCVVLESELFPRPHVGESDGFDRGTGPKRDYIFIHFLPITNTWVWQIPITDTITSFGAVTQKKNFAKSKASREQWFWHCMATRPELLEKLEAADRVRPFVEEADYSYGMKQPCGDGFALVGDAQRFVDPIFSSGVSLALNGARLVAADLIAVLVRPAW